jgi:hypothetical protein
MDAGKIESWLARGIVLALVCKMLEAVLSVFV